MENIVKSNLLSGKEISYKIVNGTAYHVDTPDAAVAVLERFRSTNKRIRVFYGDTETGRDWLEEHDIMGYLERSSGSIKIPLLVHNMRSVGGGAVLDHCIVRITVDGLEYYRHPKYHRPILECRDINLTAQGKTYTAGIYKKLEGENLANFETKEKALRWMKFILGDSNRK